MAARGTRRWRHGDSALIGCAAADTREPCVARETEPCEWRHHDHSECCARHDVRWPLLHGLGGPATLDQQPSLICWAFPARLPNHAYCARSANVLAVDTRVSSLNALLPASLPPLALASQLALVLSGKERAGVRLSEGVCALNARLSCRLTKRPAC